MVCLSPLLPLPLNGVYWVWWYGMCLQHRTRDVVARFIIYSLSFQRGTDLVCLPSSLDPALSGIYWVWLYDMVWYVPLSLYYRTRDVVAKSIIYSSYTLFVFSLFERGMSMVCFLSRLQTLPPSEIYQICWYVMVWHVPFCLHYKTAKFSYIWVL